MAKTKKKNNPTPQRGGLSQDDYMRKVMRSLPVDKCYVNSDWQEQGMAHAIVVRRRPDGKFALANYLVDTFCLGVKDAFWRTRLDDIELKEIIDNYKGRIDLEECSYATVHNLVLGAVEFAEEGGIEPCREWAVGQYGLDEDSDDIELIEFDYGLDGQHFLNTRTRTEGAKYLPILQAHLGDNFSYRFEDEEDDMPYDDDYAEEPYIAPEGVEYPAELNLKHPEVGEILLNKDYIYSVPLEEMAKIAAIDRDDLLADLNQLAMYKIGLDPEKCEEDGAMMHVVTILNSLADPRGLDTLLAMLRMSADDLDFFFGDVAPQLFASAIYRCSMGRLPDLESFLNEPARTWYNRSMVLEALELVFDDEPEEVVGILRRQLESLPERIDELVSADVEYAGFVASACMKTDDRSLLPLIKTLFDNDQIDPRAVGDYKAVEKDYGEHRNVEAMTMSEIYDRIKHFNEPRRNNDIEVDYEGLWK